MIYDKLENIHQYASDNSVLSQCFKDIESSLHADLHPDEMASKVYKKSRIQFATAPKCEKRFESHRKYIDIHIVLKGREYVEVGSAASLTNRTEYDPDQDILFGDMQEGEGGKLTGYLEPGRFLVCFPDDAHLVGAHEHTAAIVEKFVYKIPV
ncbi:YhcH/YjgK/YiaL family protein [Paenibacillus sp. SAF-054]|uniref:YhcH/YjgK/YiaL family protein n=1 Tax=unclassified Paenibacillus TaxID=185978 RepID=UPI003F80B9D3